VARLFAAFLATLRVARNRGADFVRDYEFRGHNTIFEITHAFKKGIASLEFSILRLFSVIGYNE
jgi:hypothetical protein